jgi:hypothetical protein
MIRGHVAYIHRDDKKTCSIHTWADKRTGSIPEKRLEEVLRKAHLGDLWFSFCVMVIFC